MSDAHKHHPGCTHHHPQPSAAGRRIGFAFFLNLGFAMIELVGGLLTNSLAILSDALHDLGDALGLGLAWWFEGYSQKLSDNEHTYGYRRWSVLSALVSAGIIMAGSIFIAGHAVTRLLDPQPVISHWVIALAVLGVVVNIIGYLKLSAGSSLNEKVLKYHLLEDVTGWLVVLVGAIVIYFTGWYWVDPLMALAISGWIFVHVLTHFKESLRVFMQMWPDQLDLGAIKNHIKSFQGVTDVHHLHGWSIDGERHIATMHVVLHTQADRKSWALTKKQIKQELKSKWNIVEVTLESEWADEECVDPTHDPIDGGH